MSRPVTLPGFDDAAAPPGGAGAPTPTRLDAAAAIQAFGDLIDGRPEAARELRRLGFRVVQAQGRRLDVDAARDLFGRYAAAIAAGRFSEVAPLTRRLRREAGLVALWLPRRAEP